MPELPEVEAVRRTLENLIVGKEITNVWATYPNIVKEPNVFEQFAERMKGEVFESILRKGKFLILETNNYAIVSHLRMEGKYVLADVKDAYHKHVHIFFTFSDGTELRYEDVRKFGTMHLTKKGQHLETSSLKKLGPDVIDEHFTEKYLNEKIKNSQRNIKNLLLDQEIVAGLGNIYVDEVLFQAKIHPLQIGKVITKQERVKLVQGAKEILQKAVEMGGSTIRTYVNAQGKAGTFQNALKVYGRANEPCIHCKTEIEKIKVSGRGTHYCPKCQIYRT